VSVFRSWRDRCAAIRHEFAAPLPDERGLSRGARLRARSRRLAAKYGWRIVVAAVMFYLVRDLVLYVLLPYLAIRAFAW